MAGLGGHQQHHLCPCEGAQFVRLQREGEKKRKGPEIRCCQRATNHNLSNRPLVDKSQQRKRLPNFTYSKHGKCRVAARLTFFIIPDFLLEKVV